jgi:ribosomal protein L18
MNAGGLNPHGARDAVARAFKEKGYKAKIAVVTGDSISERIDELQSGGETLAHLDTGADIATVRDKIVFANAYLGAAPIAEALAQGADIVITGRVADAALSLGPIMHELGWRWDDWEKLAQGLTVGHLLECSGQATGGNFGSAGEWAKVQNFVGLGYPIAEVSEDGTAVVTNAPRDGLSSLEKDLRSAKGTKTDRAKAVGTLVAKRAKAAGIDRVVFDRAGFRYHGRVKSLAEAAREAGLDF